MRPPHNATIWQAKPYLPISHPRLPPSANLAIPVVEMTPVVVASV